MATTNDKTKETDDDARYQETAITCFRCGVCCTRYQGILSIAEAERIADVLGISLAAFRERYVDEAWPEPENFLLEAHDGACVFLKRSAGSKVTSCLVHATRPLVCQEWRPGWHRQECRDGLAEYWNLTVSPSGELQGSRQSIQDFQAFLKSLDS